MDPWTKPEHFDEEVKASANDDYQHVCDGSMLTPDLSQHASNQQLSQYDALAPSMYPAAPLEDHTCYDYDNCFLGREVQDSTRLEWSVATARQACMHRSGSSANVDLEECVQQHSRQGLRFIGGENYAVMLWTCLREAPGNSMSVQEMYQWVQDKTDKDHDALQLFAQGHNEAARKSRRGWQCSVRHNLSMNKAFIKVTKGIWTLDPAYHAGIKPTTRYRTNKTGSSNALSSGAQSESTRERRQNAGRRGGEASRANAGVRHDRKRRTREDHQSQNRDAQSRSPPWSQTLTQYDLPTTPVNPYQHADPTVFPNMNSENLNMCFYGMTPPPSLSQSYTSQTSTPSMSLTYLSTPSSTHASYPPTPPQINFTTSTAFDFSNTTDPFAGMSSSPMHMSMMSSPSQSPTQDGIGMQFQGFDSSGWATHGSSTPEAQSQPQAQTQARVYPDTHDPQVPSSLSTELELSNLPEGGTDMETEMMIQRSTLCWTNGSTSRTWLE